MPEILLHQWEMSPFCNKVRRVLTAKGLEYTVLNYNGLDARKAATLSTAGTLPVMDYDGERIADSSAIARFLDEWHPEPPLYPTDPVALAEARRWDDWAGKSLYAYEVYFRMLPAGPLDKALDLICEGRPRWERALMKMVFKRRYPQKMKWLGLGRLPAAEVERQLLEHLADIDTILERRPYLVGDAPCIADHAVAAQIDELLRTSELAPRVRELAHIDSWLGRL